MVQVPKSHIIHWPWLGGLTVPHRTRCIAFCAWRCGRQLTMCHQNDLTYCTSLQSARYRTLCVACMPLPWPEGLDAVRVTGGTCDLYRSYGGAVHFGFTFSLKWPSFVWTISALITFRWLLNCTGLKKDDHSHNTKLTTLHYMNADSYDVPRSLQKRC